MQTALQVAVTHCPPFAGRARVCLERATRLQMPSYLTITQGGICEMSVCRETAARRNVETT